MNNERSVYGRKDPVLADCVTTGVGKPIPGTSRELYYCTVLDAECRYARPLGFDYICKHPESHLFSAPE